MTPRSSLAIACLLGSGILACAYGKAAAPLPGPRITPHADWETQRPVGHTGDGTRRNLKAGDSLTFHDFRIGVISTAIDSSASPTPVDVVRLRLARADAREERSAREGDAFNWHGYHVAIVAIYGPGELGAGLVAIEIARLSTIPASVAMSMVAGGADFRLRVPHRITHVTLHHTGSPEPLKPEDDPREKLRGLQSWGARDRNWWDVPYHYLIDLDGRIYEGRDYHYMGETNTTYDPEGHFLISVIGNYGRQEATPAQLEAIADLMAWALRTFDLPLDRIGGHYNYADTDCPGKNLRQYLDDGTLRRMVSSRLAHR
jgi:N-acetylmuramoyl-L-alanine amidase